MYDPPSQTLIDRLENSGICTRRDVLAQYRTVRRLARDLPTFDSVWIDALVQAKKLTRYQASILESKNPDRLQMGPCLILDQLSQTTHSETFLARYRKNYQQCVLKVIKHQQDGLPAVHRRLEQLVHELHKRPHAALAVPSAAVLYQEQLLVVSPYIAGANLKELLVRRGRFPSLIVQDIANQLIGMLAALEARGHVHSDLRLSKIRISRNGRVHLVDVGIRKAVFPQLQIPEGRYPERFDYIAPELIGTTQQPDVRSDIYAFGCLLWHLLAGRPPFMTGDPLAKLAAHQTEPIENVREWAPDTSEQFANAIRVFTSKDPDQRPQSFREIRSHWKTSRLRSRNRLKTYQAKTHSSSNADYSGSAGLNWKLLVPVLFVVMGLSLTLLDQGARGQFLALASRLRPAQQPAEWTEIAEPSVTDNDVTDTKLKLKPLPHPDEHGVIRLTESGLYDVAELSAVNQLLLKGETKVKPVLIVRDRPLKIWADLVMLENIEFRYAAPDDPAAAKPDALVMVQSQSLVLQQCHFESGSVSTETSQKKPPSYCVGWKQIDPINQVSSQIHLKNCMFIGASSSLFLAKAVPVIRVHNVGKIGTQPFITMADQGVPNRETHLDLSHVTLRQSGALLRLLLAEKNSRPLRLFCQTNNCVFDLHAQTPALLEQWGSQLTAERLTHMELYGEGSLCSQNLTVATVYQTDHRKRITLPDDAVMLEGISAAPYRFAGPVAEDPRQSQINSYQGPRRSGKNPGLIAAEL